MARFAIRCGLFFAVTRPDETEHIVRDGKVLIGATRDHLVTNEETIVTRLMERAERIMR